MRKLGTRSALLVCIVVLAALATASSAWAFGGASGDLVYGCPFTGGTPVQAHFWAEQTSASFAGSGSEVISYPGGSDEVKVAYVRVVRGPSGRDAYLAGPVVRSTVPGMSSFWWYMAVHDAAGTANDAIVGRYVKHKDALSAVAGGWWSENLTLLTSGALVVWR
jgi:hypothetical protein